MSDLKNQIFALVKKCPQRAYCCDSLAQAMYYPKDGISYEITVVRQEEYVADLAIYNGANVFRKKIVLTEKEFMEIKWKIQEWSEELETKAFEEFKDFAEPEEPSAMDDLLKDE